MRELELYFGPQHLGMVGNFSITLKVEGDRVLEAKANPGYLHRGFEKLMEGVFTLSLHGLALIYLVCGRMRICSALIPWLSGRCITETSF